ncbi:putative disease resistance protein RGA4 [Chenopodium quinoa]|uniref:putative disease resistance protein RGA4 n=1 Tax=Chenopodium quinoa TaxID=63459 RepID=UPI000B77D01D|nr:putative disease resistance protein RGA4 [Chenopodium quinoa]
MAELGIVLAERLIEVTGSAIIKEICDKWGYKSQLQDLIKTVSTIKNVLLDADSKRKLPYETRGYIEDLKAAIYDADDLFDEFFILAELKLLDGNKDDKFLKKVRRFFSGKKKEVSQAYRMSRQVKDIKKQLDTIVSNHHKFGLSVDYNPICRRREETCSYVDAGDIIGREDDKKVVIDMLLGPNDVQESFRFVTIVGVGGLGKTALAQLVCNDNEVEAEFPDPKLRLWVCVSDQDGEQFDVKVILCKILELVSGKRPDDTSSMELVQKQFQEQLRGKKYLLVLDDVWNEDCEKWRNLCRFLTLGQEGSRIVVTTRSEMTAKIIGEKHTHKLQGLSEENSWLLFESVAFDKGEHEHASHLELVEIGKKIVEKCYNIPLAIKAVGSLLFGQPVNKWQTFEHSGFAGIGKGDNEIMSILKLSYHNLRPSLKNCFSYCALFPKDFRLERKELISLWMAQGYIASLDRDQSVEDAAEEHFLILVRRCFFQDVKKDRYGDIGSVKIHDLMHDVALEVGREEIAMVTSNTTKLGDKVRHVYFGRGTFSQNYSLKSKMRSFISRGKLGYVVNAHIDNWMCVRVLVLRGAGIVRLPDSIGKLLHLRYLDLSFNYNLEGLSDSISRLHNLQTLDLNHCGGKLRELPKKFSELIKLRHLDLNSCKKLTGMPCMDKLTNLRYLNISYCQELSSLPSSMDKLTSLRHFDLRGCYSLTSIPTTMGQLASLRHFDLSECHNLTSMPIGMDMLTSLRHFDLSRCDKLTSMPSGMGKLTNLRVLPLFVVGMERRVSIEERCMGDLKDLKPLTNLIGGIEIKIGKNYMNDDGGGGYLKGMKHLTEVEILFSYENDGCVEWEGVMEKLEPPSNLKKFVLRYYKSTKIPSWGRAQDNWAISFQHLVNIHFKCCSNLVQIPQLSKLHFLKSLSLDRLWKLEYIENKSSYTGNEREELMTFFPSLETLEICKLKSLKGWWREEDLVEGDDDHILRSSFTFPRLSKLVIYMCPKLTSFPSSPSLENLDLNDVGLLKSMHSSQFLNNLHIKSNGKVVSLSELEDVFRRYTSSLQSLRISYCPNLQRLGKGGLEHLTALESLVLDRNNQLSFSEDEATDDGMPWKSLHHCLRSLTIIECSAIKSLPESMQKLTSLEELEIFKCPDELKESCKQPGGKDWPNIQHIPSITINVMIARSASCAGQLLSCLLSAGIDNFLYHLQLFAPPVLSISEQNMMQNHLRADENDIVRALKISYYYLPYHLKSCFSYCAVFPEHYKIKKEDLISLWMAQGFIVPLGGESLEDAGEEYFMNLLQRGFFQDVERADNGEILTCKMHDLIHDLAIEVAGAEILSSSYNTSYFDKKTRHLFVNSTVGRKDFGRYLTTMKRMRTILNIGYPNPLESPDVLLPKVRYLRVLDLHGASFEKLPNMIGELLHLRYLDLSCNRSLSVLPLCITELYNLQTFLLRGCESLKELPRDFRKLVNLRCLDIFDCNSMTHMPPGMNSMTCLNKLTMFLVGGTSSACCLRPVGAGGLSDLKYLNNLTGSMEIKVHRGLTYDAAEAKKGGHLINKQNLRGINICWTQKLCGMENPRFIEDDSEGTNAEALLHGLQPHPNLKLFGLWDYPGVRFPSWGSSLINFETCLPNIVEIELYGCKSLEHLPLLSQLRYLKSLELVGLIKLEYVESIYGDEAPKASVVSRKAVSVAVPRLSYLHIRLCWNLTDIPLCTKLEKLESRFN